MRKCDIVIVTWNQLEYTRLCVASVMAHTDVPSRLIIVDNGSSADTVDYLKSLTPNKFVEIKLIFNNENLGAIKARNTGIREFEADYLCLLDNDVEVTPGWLSKMIRLAEENPGIGAINPSSNNFGQVPPAGTGLNDYAKSLEGLKGQYLEIGTCISFCMLIKGGIVKKIGLLDENFEVMFYEDTDYSMRVNKEGYRCVIQKDVYIWHHGHMTSGRLKRQSEIADKNRDIFYKKWGRPLRIMWCLSSGEEDKKTKEALGSCVELARDGNFVYLFTRGGLPKEGAQHANVHITALKDKGFGCFCLWRLITKRKKSYDMVIADDNGIISLMTPFGFFYKARVMPAGDLNSMLAAAHVLKFK